MAGGQLHFEATIEDKDFNNKLNGMKKGIDGLTFDKPTESIKRLKNEIEEVSTTLNENRKSLALLDKQLAKTSPGTLQNNLQLERNSLAKSIKEDEVALKGLNAELIKTKASHTTVNAELLKTRQQMQALDIAGKRNTAEYQALSAKAKEYSNTLKQVNRDTKELAVSTEQATKKSGGLKNVFTTVASYFGVYAGIEAVIGLIKGAFNTIVQFDSRLLNVSKTTGLAGQELKDLGVAIRGLSEELKVVSIDKLLEFAGIAGQLGIKGTNDILAFTEALAQLSTTSNISGEEGAIQIARFLGLVEGDVKNVKDLGDELTKLGNNFKVFEDEIIKNALAIAQNTGTFELGRREILAYATSLKEAGIEAELTGSSLGRTYQQISTVLSTGKNIENLSKITGQSVEELKRQFKTDPQGVIYSFVKGLNEIQKSGGDVNNAIRAIGITAGRDLRVIGSLATGGFAVLERAMYDVQNASGAMQQEFDTASTKIANSIEGVKVSWENLILSINGSENVIGSVANAWLKGLSIIIDGINKVSTGWRDLMKIQNAQAGQQAYDFEKAYWGDDFAKSEKKRKDALEDRKRYADELAEINKEIAKTDSKLRNDEEDRSWLGYMFMGDRGIKSSKESVKALSQEAEKLQNQIKAIDDLQSDFNGNKTKEVKESLKEEALLTEEQRKKALKDTEALYKKRLAFLDELQKAENNLTQSTLTGLDLELAKVTETYNERIKKAKELKANQDAINRIEALRTRETEIVTFKAETEGIKAGLETLRKDYEDFENAKKQIGIQKATELYKEQLDISKTYQQALADEINNLSGRDLNDLEKARLAELMKLYADYNIQKQNDDRKRLEELYTMTADFEQKLFVLKQDYEKKKADLEATTSGEDLAGRLAILEKEYREKASELISTFADEKGFGTAITQGFIGATKQIITAQIQSLRTYLKNAKDLTKVQIDEIEKLISNLDDKLYNATDSGEGGALRGINVQINGLKKSLSDLEDRKKFLESLGLPETKTELAEIEATIAGILVQLDSLAGAKARAIGAEFTKISDIFSDLASSFEGIGGSANNVFKSLSKIAGLSSTISNTFASIKDFQEAQKSEEGASFTQGLGAFTGVFSSVMGVFSMIKGVFDEMEKAEDRAAQIRIESYIKTLEFERELARLETERIRRNALNLSDKGRELDSVDKEILLKQRQLAEIQERLNTFGFWYLKNEERAFFENLLSSQTDIQKLYDDLKKLKEAGVEFTKEQAEQFDILEKFWLGNRSWEELQQVLNNLTGDYIRDDMRAYVEQAIKLGKELEEAGYTLEDIQNMIREMATGTSIEQLSDSLADAFRNGEDAVYSFGQTIEEVLKNAIITAFKNEFIVKEMKPLFDLMGDLGADGQYTQEELDELREKARQIAETLQMQWDAINGSLDMDFSNADDFGAGAKDSVKRITEQQADRLTGILTGVQVDVIASRQILFESKNLLSSSLDNLVKIEYNTARTYQALERIESNLQNNQAQALGMP